MKTYILNIWDTLRSSYWFIPSLFAFATLVLFWLTLSSQSFVRETWTFVPGWFLSRADTARAILSAVAGAIVAVTGTVFSITIVILSLASQQFGPRLLRRFMYDLPTQVTLGIFLATGFYSLLALAAVEASEVNVSEFHLSVFFTFGLTVLSMLTLIFFIHNVTILIQAPHVVASVAKDLGESIDRIFPENLDGSEENPEANRDQSEIGSCKPVISVDSNSDGYVQAINDESLMELAIEKKLIFQCCVRPGDFVTKKERLVDIWCEGGGERLFGEEEFEELKKKINEVFILGIRRTPRQDVECAVEELAEVAVRSLSPGVNDPFTAINCIDYLGAALARLARRRFPPISICDKDGIPRIYIRPITFKGVLGASFHQIRQYGRSSVAVTIHMLEALDTIACQLVRSGDREALRHHADMIARNTEAWPEESDKGDAKKRYERVILALGKG